MLCVCLGNCRYWNSLRLSISKQSELALRNTARSEKQEAAVPSALKWFPVIIFMKKKSITIVYIVTLRVYF